jgi:Fic family protein
VRGKPDPDQIIRELGSRKDALVCAPHEKAHFETENSLFQFEYLQKIVKERDSRLVRELDVVELQRIAIERIYPCGGDYRKYNFTMEITGSGHTPPPATHLRSLVIEMVDWCNDAARPALYRAAYALWRFNWLHPFPGGNGRSARALCYLVIAFDLGRIPPGESSSWSA